MGKTKENLKNYVNVWNLKKKCGNNYGIYLAKQKIFVDL